jgi:hypothetical protein
LAVLLGLGIAIVAMSILSACFSAGGSMLIWLVGIPIIGLGIELSRVFARVERWRMTMVDRRPMEPHRYRPFDGLPHRPYGPWLRDWAEVQFLDANRWRDVIYVLILFPLALLEFVVILGLWVAAVGLIGHHSSPRPVARAARPRGWPAGRLTGLSVAAVIVGLVLAVAASAARA